MNKAKLVFPICLTCLFFLFSCQKEVNDPDIVNNNPVSADSSYLSKMYIIDADGSGIVDTFETYTYVYDNLKRVSVLLDSSEDNTLHVLIPFQTTQYYYNGNDTLPFKSITISYNSGSNYDTTTNFFAYNVSGKLAADSGLYIVNPPNPIFVKDIRSYQYGSAVITGIRTVTTINQNGTSVSVEKDTAQTDANGNIIHNIKNRDFETVNSTFTWDTHPSPFARISNFQTFAIVPFGETFFYEMPSKNNRLHVTEITTDNSSGTVQHNYDDDLTGKYSYNITGYPSQILIPDPAVPGAYERIVFIYKAF